MATCRMVSGMERTRQRQSRQETQPNSQMEPKQQKEEEEQQKEEDRQETNDIQTMGIRITVSPNVTTNFHSRWIYLALCISFGRYGHISLWFGFYYFFK